MARVTHVRVEGLLDYFTHVIDFPSQWNYILLYGPNGVGKTKLLELVQAIFTCSFDEAAAIPFTRFEARQDDGSSLVVDRRLDAGAEGLHLHFAITSPSWNGELEGVFRDFGNARLRRRLLETSSWSPVGGNLWRDSTDGEIVDWTELVDRFDGPFGDSSNRNKARDEMPELVIEYLRSTPVHFIATQRLLYDLPPRSRTVIRGGRQQNTRKATIAAYTDDLRLRLSNALSENSKRTQQLDRSFPRRVLEMNRQDIDAGEIRKRYVQQNKKRRELAEIGLIGAEVDLPLPDRDLDQFELNVLLTYLDDTDKKLETFDDIAARVSLLRHIANSRFFNKTLTVNVDDGIVIRRDSDQMLIHPESLSSGEQHEMVLLYDLLFNVPSNAMVLIDEPEISLHIAWQKEFINDIDRIAGLASLRFIIATHSPQIINKSWDQTAELGPSISRS